MTLSGNIPTRFSAVPLSSSPACAGVFWVGIQDYPEAWTVTTGPMWGELVKYININFYDELEAFKTLFCSMS